MKLLWFIKNGVPALALQTDNGILDADACCAKLQIPAIGKRNITNDDLPVLQQILQQEAQLTDALLNEHEIQITSCVPDPQKIICIGLNYKKHAAESGMQVPPVPVVFNKFNNTLINFGAKVHLGNVGEQFDYEVELCVVMGKACKEVGTKDALNYVLGYCVANDMSCRDLQFRSSQWLMGKSLDTFLPLGKCVVTADEIPDPQNLQLTCTMNGELRQNSNTADMIFSIAEIIEDLSKHFTLMPGDLILTGTPEGVILGMKEKNWLRPGDVVKVSIEKLGYTENLMVR